MSDLLDQVTACSNCSTARTPFAGCVRHAIHQDDRSLRQVAEALEPYGQLASGFATLSDWQNGVATPLPNDRGIGRVLALERVLGVRAGDIVLALPGLDGVAAIRRRPTDPLVLRLQALEREVAEQIGPQRVAPVAIDKDYLLGWRAAPVATMITTTVRALHDGVDRYVFRHAPGTCLHPTVHRRHGCTVGAVHRERIRPDAGPALAAVELLFDRRLRKGERYRFGFSVGYVGQRPAEPVFRHVQVQPCERLHLTLSFDPAWRPATVAECRWREADLKLVARRPRAGHGFAGFELAVSDPVPAGYGWEWSP